MQLGNHLDEECHAQCIVSCTGRFEDSEFDLDEEEEHEREVEATVLPEASPNFIRRIFRNPDIALLEPLDSEVDEFPETVAGVMGHSNTHVSACTIQKDCWLTLLSAVDDFEYTARLVGCPSPQRYSGSFPI